MRAAAAKPSRTLKRLGAQLRGAVGRAIADYRMIADGDRVMVCVSGGKDSYTLLDILMSLRRSAPVNHPGKSSPPRLAGSLSSDKKLDFPGTPVRFELIAVNLDQKQPGFPEHVLPQYLAAAGVPFHIIEQDTYSVVRRVVPEGRTLCGLCSRLRRGALYRFAAENGITKIALGHHRDDIVETLFLNLFFAGRLKAMAPKLLSDDGRHVVIRPLAYVAARDIARYARGRAFPLIPCTLCGSQENLQRVAVRRMLERWEREFPGRTESIFSALRHVEPAHLADPRRFDFAALEGRRVAPGQAGRPAPGQVPPMSEADEDALADAVANSPALA